ncbi:MAG: hypothetical protein AB7Q29_08390 [Vicinamibacterales bacterium]
MRPDDLTPADRELAQLTLIRVHLARIARRKWHAERAAVSPAGAAGGGAGGAAVNETARPPRGISTPVYPARS